MINVAYTMNDILLIIMLIKNGYKGTIIRIFKKYITIVPFHHITSYDSSSAIRVYQYYHILTYYETFRGNENISNTLIGTYFS